jgi:hypothetical protein
MSGITSRALPSPTSTGRASIIRSVASVFAFSMFMFVLLSTFFLVYGAGEYIVVFPVSTTTVGPKVFPSRQNSRAPPSER